MDKLKATLKTKGKLHKPIKKVIRIHIEVLEYSQNGFPYQIDEKVIELRLKE